VPTNPAGLVYGTILVAAMLAAESTKRETYPTTIAAVSIAMIVYWLANSYARFTGERAREGTHFEFGTLARDAVHELWILGGAVIPLVMLLVCWAAGGSLGSAVSVAIWSAVAMIVFTELGIGIRSHLTGRELVIQTAFGMLLGVLVIAVRVLLH
jgi:hypothetical protein